MNQTKVAVKIAVSAFAFAALLTSGMAHAQQDEPYHHIGRRPPPPPPQASGYHKTCSPLPPQYPPCEYGGPCGDIHPPRPFPDIPPKPLEDRGMQRALKETIEALSSGASGETTSMSASKTFDALGKFLKSGIGGKNGRKGFITPVDCLDYCNKNSSNTTSCSQSCTKTDTGKSCQTTCN